MFVTCEIGRENKCAAEVLDLLTQVCILQSRVKDLEIKDSPRPNGRTVRPDMSVILACGGPCK